MPHGDGFRSQVADVGIGFEGCAGLVHADMPVEANTHQHHIQSAVVFDKLVHLVALLLDVGPGAIEEDDLVVGNVQRVKQVFVHHLPARALVAAVHSHPLVEPQKDPPGDVELASFHVGDQAFEYANRRMARCQANKRLRGVFYAGRNKVGCFPGKLVVGGVGVEVHALSICCKLIIMPSLRDSLAIISPLRGYRYGIPTGFWRAA